MSRFPRKISVSSSSPTDVTDCSPTADTSPLTPFDATIRHRRSQEMSTGFPDTCADKTPPIPLGPFELNSLLGQGGMGEVWRGSHVGQQVPVAIKVVTAQRARDPLFQAAFRAEVRAVAGLRHPGIVMVFDLGEVSEAAQRLSEGRLAAGGPYLAMELGQGGSLSDRVYPLGWWELRSVLFGLLDALAHAHARGVIHRDIKPANVLVSRWDSDGVGVKLTDFGVAHALDNYTRTCSDGTTQSDHERPVGTPDFMSPEQIKGQWRDYGPWTDLYSLGCMAYELATGRPPFQGKRFSELAHAHLNTPPPRLPSAAGFPPGFDEWILRLLEKDPHLRPQRAADAAWELARIGNVGDEWDEFVAGTFGLSDAETVSTTAAEWTGQAHDTENATTLNTARTSQDTAIWHVEQDTPHSEDTETVDVAFGEDAQLSALPPLPKSWRQQAKSGPSLRLVGAGLGLYGLRAVPLINRERERDVIWEHLRTVADTGQTQAVLLRGPAGVGKSRLAEWISQRAHEVGAATVLKAVHSRIAGATDALPGMLARYLRCVGLPRQQVLHRVVRTLEATGVSEDYEAHALTELIAPTTDKGNTASGWKVHFQNPKQRYALISRFLCRLGKQRPVILWLDDIHWGNDTLGFVLDFVADLCQTPRPVLFLLTTRDEALAERAVESGQVDQLMKAACGTELPLGPLASSDQSALVRELLNLEGILATQVEQRTNGNPLFAVQLVGDWVQRGLLEVGERGFCLASGQRPELPDNLHQVWSARLDRLALELGENRSGDNATFRAESPASLPLEPVVESLELAAALGDEVDRTEWKIVCQMANVPIPPKLLDSLMTNRLAHPVEAGGFSFVHGMLRESLERRARDRGRWEKHNHACVAMLKTHYQDGQPGLSERLGRHLVDAGELEAALDPLLEAGKESLGTYAQTQIHTLLERRESVLSDLGFPEDHIAWSQGWLLHANLLLSLGEYKRAQSSVDRIEPRARRNGWRWILAKILTTKAQILRACGDPELAESVFGEALQLFQEIEDADGMIACWRGLALAHNCRGDFEAALERLQNAVELAEKCEDPMNGLKTLVDIALVQWSRGDLKAAKVAFEQALVSTRALGNSYGEAYCLNGLADVDRSSGHLEAAEVKSREALAISQRLGNVTPMTQETQLILGFILLARAQYKEARELLFELRRDMKRRGMAELLTGVGAALLACDAERRDWRAWDQHLTELSTLLDKMCSVNPDLPWTLELAGDLAVEAGQTERARQAYEIAVSQWEGLGRPEKADMLRSRMFSSEPSSG